MRVVFKHLPLQQIHPQAIPAARAAFCAEKQDKFWEFHDALFTSNGLKPEVYTNIAKKLNLNLASFNSCIESESSIEAINKDISEAQRLGINGTPTFIINGKIVVGINSVEQFNKIIEDELRKVQGI